MTSRLMEGSIVVTQALAGRRFSYEAMMLARASRAQLARMEWPWSDLVELTGIWAAREPKIWWRTAASVDVVPE